MNSVWKNVFFHESGIVEGSDLEVYQEKDTRTLILAVKCAYGVNYVGIVDNKQLDRLISALQKAKEMTK